MWRSKERFGHSAGPRRDDRPGSRSFGLRLFRRDSTVGKEGDRGVFFCAIGETRDAPVVPQTLGRFISIGRNTPRLGAVAGHTGKNRIGYDY